MDIVKMMVGEATRVLTVGVLVGLPMAHGAARAASALLFGLTPYDPLTLVLASGGLTGVALLAAYIPARRAARLDPTIALRQD